MKKRQLSYQQKHSLTGRLFVLPWFIGFLLFFLVPLAKSFYYTFTEINYDVSGFKIVWVGLENYLFAFTKDPDYIQVLINTVGNMFYEVPIIVLFALFVAVILNQEFRGRTVARAIFFLPVIITSGVIVALLRADIFSSMISQGNAQSAYMFQSSGLQQMLLENKVPEQIVTYFTRIITNIFNLTWRSGVQILLFIAGLKTIPGTLYEAAKVEGATPWESFWKITFPMVSPIILANVIYTVIDSFTDFNNMIIQMINNAGFQQVRYGYSSAIAWVYFVIVFIIVGVVNALISRKVFYMAN